MNHLTSNLLVRKLVMKKKTSKVQQKEEDIDMLENPYQKAITNIDTKDKK